MIGNTKEHFGLTEEVENSGKEAAIVSGANQSSPRMGRYHILEILGEGGMGSVYRAYDPELERPVALKVIRLPAGSGTEDTNELRLENARQRLIREARTLAQLSHPNIISIFDIGLIDNRDVYFAMELIEGEALSEVLHKQKLAWPQVYDLFWMAGQGLAAAHSVGLVHRDFKPDNCIVGKDGQLKVLDFGLATDNTSSLVVASNPDPVDKDSGHDEHSLPGSNFAQALGIGAVHRQFGKKSTPWRRGWGLATGILRTKSISSASSPSRHSENPNQSGIVYATRRHSQLTFAGDIMGTPRYMSPEQAAGGLTCATSDVYSFCVVLYEALCGHHPLLLWGRRTPNYKVHPEELPWAPTVPRWLRVVVAQGLSQDPRDRPSHAGELMEQLHRARMAAEKRRRFWSVQLPSVCVLACLGVAGAKAFDRKESRIDCDAQADTILQLWSEDTMQALRGYMSHEHGSGSSAQWRKIHEYLDRWVDQWRDTKKQQCHVSFPEMETMSRSSPQPALQTLGPADAELARLCLEQRSAQLNALLQGWMHEPDSRKQAVLILEKLKSPTSCLDPDEIRAQTPMPDKPELRLQVHRLRVELEELTIAAEQHRHTYIEARLDIWRRAVLATGDDALIADLWLLLQSLEQVLQRPELGLEACRRGIPFAIRAGHWRTAARLRINEIYFGHYRLGSENDGALIKESLTQAQAWTRAGGSPSKLLHELMRIYGIWHARNGQLFEAKSYFEKSLAYARASTHEDSGIVAQALTDLVITYGFLGKTALGRPLAREALDISIRLYGPQDSNLAHVQRGYAETLMASRESKLAVMYYERALENCLGGATNPNTCAAIFVERATAYHNQGDYARASESWSHILTLGLSRHAFTDPDVPWPESWASSTLIARGEVDIARNLAQRGWDKIKVEARASREALRQAWARTRRADLYAGRNVNPALSEFSDTNFEDTETTAIFRAEYELFHGRFVEALHWIALGERLPPRRWSSSNYRAMRYQIRAQALRGLGEYQSAIDAAEYALAILRSDDGLFEHLRYPVFETLAEIYWDDHRPYECLEAISKARKYFDPVHVHIERLARLDFLEARARWIVYDEQVAQREAFELAMRALERYQARSDRPVAEFRELQQWLASHSD